jgi:hypothetical protein
MPTEVISLVAGVITKIQAAARNVKENKDKCSKLSQRAELILLTLETSLKKDEPASDSLEKAIDNLKNCLDEILSYIEKFTGETGIIKKAANSGSRKEAFESLDKELTNAVHDLNLVLNITNNNGTANQSSALNEDEKVDTSAIPTTPTTPIDPEAEYQQGLKAQEESKFLLAKIHFNKAANSGHQQALDDLLCIYMDQEKYNEAFRYVFGLARKIC